MPITLNRDSLSYKALDYPFKGFDPSELELYNHVKLPMYTSSATKRKILFVFDYVPAEDLKTGRLLSGEQGHLFSNIIRNVSERMYIGEKVNFSWLAVSFNAFRTAGKSPVFQKNARHAFGKRIEFIISRYKPDTVVLMGYGPIEYFYADELALSSGKHAPWFGVPREKEIRGHKCTFYSNLSLNTLATNRKGESALIGYFGRTLANAIAGKHLFVVDADLLSKHRSVLIDTVRKFDKLMDKLEAYTGPVAVDTETSNLNRVVNKLLTIQFAVKQDIGYLIPLNHKDTPFVASELKYITKRLTKFFEGNNKNKYHIYANAEFDLNLHRARLGVRYLHNDVYDIFGGEFIIDENLKWLSSASPTGDYYYSLGNLCSQYGYTGYMTAEFGKKDRGSIESHDLDDALLRYGTLDVVTLLAIREAQLKVAARLKHNMFETQVVKQIGDMLHNFVCMEQVGNRIDVDYLFYLKTPTSPIEREISSIRKKLLSSSAVKKANKRLMKRSGVSTRGWQGEVVVDMFSLSKPDHKALLFFDVLGLEPLSQGKSGKGKIDKEFQAAYSSVPEVAMFSSLGKAVKLKDSYVTSFIKKLDTSDDFRHDKCLRPRYQYLKVITGRTSCEDPNLQNIPARSALGKEIKRLFIAELGFLYVKVDYRVHEVRCWGLISSDKSLAKVFQDAKDMRDEYRRHPTAKLGKKLEVEADIHVINAMYFFSATAEKVMANGKELRNAVKGVVFGLIYQMAVKTLAGNLGKTLDFTKNLVKNFQRRFPRGMKWIETTKEFAAKNLYVESPFGLRRHLFGYLMDSDSREGSKVHGDMDRRAVNSPVQGLGAQCMAIGARQLQRLLWETRKKSHDTGLKICNSVHDSLENKSPYLYLLQNIGLIEQALTAEVRREAKARYGLDFVVDLEIDFEIGASLSSCSGWDFSLVQLEELVLKSLVFQKTELKYDLSLKSTMKQVFVDGFEYAPKWLKVQAKNIGWTFDYEEVCNRILSQLDASVSKAKSELNTALAAVKDAPNDAKLVAASAKANSAFEYARANRSKYDVLVAKTEIKNKIHKKRAA